MFEGPRPTPEGEDKTGEMLSMDHDMQGINITVSSVSQKMPILIIVGVVRGGGVSIVASWGRGIRAKNGFFKVYVLPKQVQGQRM